MVHCVLEEKPVLLARTAALVASEASKANIRCISDSLRLGMLQVRVNMREVGSTERHSAAAEINGSSILLLTLYS